MFRCSSLILVELLFFLECLIVQITLERATAKGGNLFLKHELKKNTCNYSGSLSDRTLLMAIGLSVVPAIIFSKYITSATYPP